MKEFKDFEDAGKTGEFNEKRERAVLGALLLPKEEDTLTELKGLAESAGAEVVGEFAQRKEPESYALFGKGKLSEIKAYLGETEADVFICDNELSGSQLKNLTEELGVKVIDRSTLILDIFARRAVSMEGKLQVELAQLKYNLPRLIGVSGRMSKYGGGIGMRGPGEKKLETDRRRIRNQINDLERRLEKLKSERDLRRGQRRRTEIKTVALAGYTNAGKSTLMNALSGAGVLAEDKLFATLDSVTRKVYAGSGEHGNANYYLLTDTVGFINKLPHEFVSAFASTLEEARQADLLLHVVDASDPDLALHYKVAEEVLRDMGVNGENTLLVCNKADLISDFMPPAPDFITVSALSGVGMEKLKTEIISRLGI